MGAEIDFTQATVMGFGLSEHKPSPTNDHRRVLRRHASGDRNVTAASAIPGNATTSGIRWHVESSRTIQMKIVIQKLNGLWHLIVGSHRIRTPFLDTQDRALVVTYARRAYPGARIFQRD